MVLNEFEYPQAASFRSAHSSGSFQCGDLQIVFKLASADYTGGH